MISRQESFCIRRVTDEAGYRAVERLRKRVFVDELGYCPDAVERESGVLAFAMGQGALFVAEHRGRPVGSIAVDWWKGLSVDHPDVRHLQMQPFAAAWTSASICSVRRWLVRREFRKTRVGMALIRAAAGFVGEHDEIRFALMDCEPRLLGLYRRLGFRRHGRAFRYAADGARSFPMYLDLTDLDYLVALRSPIGRMLHEAGRTHRGPSALVTHVEVRACLSAKGAS